MGDALLDHIFNGSWEVGDAEKQQTQLSLGNPGASGQVL